MLRDGSAAFSVKHDSVGLPRSPTMSATAASGAIRCERSACGRVAGVSEQGGELLAKRMACCGRVVCDECSRSLPRAKCGSCGQVAPLCSFFDYEADVRRRLRAARFLEAHLRLAHLVDSEAARSMREYALDLMESVVAQLTAPDAATRTRMWELVAGPAAGSSAAPRPPGTLV